MTTSAYWISDFAARAGLRYEAEPDERWIRAWEPYVTLRVPIRYEHMLEATGASGSVTIARMVVLAERQVGNVKQEVECSAWIAIAQDTRIDAVAAAAWDPQRVFAEAPELVTMPRASTGDAEFDRAFAVFAPSPAEAQRALSGSLRRLVLGWRAPVHLELRKGGFVLAPVALGPDPASLDWLLRAVHLFGEKAARR